MTDRHPVRATWCQHRPRSIFASAILAATFTAAPQHVFGQIREPLPAGRPAGEQADVPVKQVVLFSSGVGYFEHFGSVKGDGTAELRFKTDQINDVLKSLVLQDLDKGQVGTVTYPSQEPLNKTLKSFQVDITSNPPLSDLLNELRGAKITVTVADATVNGTIFGVEKRERIVAGAGGAGAAENSKVVDLWLLNLKVGHKFRAVPLDDVRDFQLDDLKLEEELDKALAALAQARDQEKKPVTINFRGQGERRVRIGYVVETPVWKTSYRLILSDAANRHLVSPATQPAESGATRPARLPGEASLQGWAIVENQTDNDWNEVQLSLVSGRPISYIQDLYHPLFVPRPVVLPDLYMSLRPQTYQGGISDEEQEKINQQRNSAGNSGMQAGGGAGGGGGGNGSSQLFGNGGPDFRNTPHFDLQAARQQQQQPIDPTASVMSAASAGQLGDLFEYTVGNVSLPRQKSAMIPIITDDVEIEKVSIYNRNVLETHPLTGARVRNSTKMHLLQGPVTVLEAGSYAGDARIDDVPPGQQRLLSYGIDLNVVVDPTEGSSLNTIETGKILKGVLTLTRKQVDSQVYAIQNKADAPKSIIIEHARDANWKLMEPAAAEETLENLYRFKTRVEAHKTNKFAVKTESITTQEIQVLSTDVGPLDEFVKSSEIPAAVRKALTDVVKQKNSLTDTQLQIDERKKQIVEITQEQTRIRDNMRTVAANSDYYNRLLKKLDEQETGIEKLQKESAELLKNLEKQRAELESSIQSLNVE